MIGAAEVADALSDLALSDEARGRLERYVGALLARNATTNLTAARTPQAVAEHVRDSLALLPHVREPHVDIGSGGGFPGIPLAIATGFRVTLVESIAKKAAFLREIASELGLSVEVVTGRAEDVGRDLVYRERFASATARAVAGVTTVLEFTIPLLEIGGVALLQRGAFSPAERIAASDAMLVLGAVLESEVRMPQPAFADNGRDADCGDGSGCASTDVAEPGAVGDDAAEGRRLLIVRKMLATGPRFPRRAGIPAKRPLCVRGDMGV